MTMAAAQCREWIEDTFPGTPISRRSCRDTNSGFISQHSAYGYGTYDSNALDLYGPGKTSGPADSAWLDRIVTELEAKRHEWSIRLILWQVKDHYNHVHVDFWPTCRTRQWCGDRNVTPVWKHSDDSLVQTTDPAPENGLYTGDEAVLRIFDKTWMAMFHSNVKGVSGFGRYYCSNDGTYDWEEDPLEGLNAPWGSNPHHPTDDGAGGAEEKNNAINYLLMGFAVTAGEANSE